MPETPIYGFSYETPQSKPGITLTGDIDGSSPILAEQVENVAAAFDSRLTAVETSGYRYLTTVLFTANGTFTKGSYSGFRALRARGVGGGGQCGGVAATGVGQAAEGGAGGGSGYAESFLVDASVPSSITVTIGAGGSSGGAGANGQDGGTTTFGAILSITGGGGGIAMAGTTGNLVAGGGGSGLGAGGNIFNIFGSGGGSGVCVGGFPVRANVGGGVPFLGGAARSASATTPGQAGLIFGAGGGGTRNGASQAAQAGAAGAAGIVLVDVFV
jgi:hypothetical protein